MSEFACEVVRVNVVPHPNADAIEIAMVGDYQSIVRKGQVKTGDLAVYIPEQAIIPKWLLRQMNLWDETKQKGMLAGSGGDRVKAIKLRGIVSQGLILPNIGPADDEGHVRFPTETGMLAISAGEGAKVESALGVKKYEPTLPAHMRGKIAGVDFDATHNYDFDNLKKKPTLFEGDELVVITEKIHGTNIQVGVVPTKNANERYYKGRVVLASKGLGAKGFVLDYTDETSLYVQAAIKHGLFDAMLEHFGAAADAEGKPIFIVGEVFGTTGSGAVVQLGFPYTGEHLDFRAFDICVGNRGTERYLPWFDFVAALATMSHTVGKHIQHVPMLYVGSYSKDKVREFTDGPTTLLPARGKVAHIREGVVVKSLTEQRNPHLGRKIAKSVSDAYLLRKGEQTEFQ